MTPALSAEDRTLLTAATQSCDLAPHPLVFVTVSGAHLYGFASADSDFDLRGVHRVPLRGLLGLGDPAATGVLTNDRDVVMGGREIDLVTHDAVKFFRMLLSRNGYVLEQLFSPLVVLETPVLERLREIGCGCVTRHHHHHYVGFANNQLAMLQREPSPRVKPLLYAWRVVLTGHHLMRTGRVEAHLPTLLDTCGDLVVDAAAVRAMIELKVGGTERERTPGSGLEPHVDEIRRLIVGLEPAAARAPLPDRPTREVVAALEALLWELRGV